MTLVNPEMKQKSQFNKECKNSFNCKEFSHPLVRPMMYGFGDDANPRQDSVELVEELMLEYLTQVVMIVLLASLFNSNS